MTDLSWLRVVFICLACVCVAIALMLRTGSLAKKASVILAAVFVALFVFAAIPIEVPEEEALSTPSSPSPRMKVTEARLPGPSMDQGFVAADACRDCHPDQYESWHRTYHRTMTQAASPESVVPSFDNVTLTSRGRTYYLFRNDGEYWVDMIDPAVEMRAFIQKLDLSNQSNVPRRKMQIVMTTGSHHHQTYWAQEPSGTMIQFPWVYHIKQDRWVFRTDSFIAPPHEAVLYNFWNMSCIGCHATGGQPRVTAETMHSVGEMGIACEACHGPGAHHVHQREVEKYGSTRITNPPVRFDVVNPNKLSPEESAKVCGQCHNVSVRVDEAKWLVEGDPYRAGQDGFFQNRTFPKPTDDTNEPVETAGGIREPTRFWPDGAVRAGGREYNGLIDSPCYIKGQGAMKLTCTSCHSLHDADPNKLVAERMKSNEACTQCHQEPRFNESIAEHTHHASDSAGSQCYDCHMPRTSYALFHAARSHRIDSPQATVTTNSMRPNACNLCHLDQTMEWTASHLSQWFNTPIPALADEEKKVPASVLWALRGDAAQRAITAWHFGWEPALETSGKDWPARFLSELLADPYGAVRYVTHESLTQLPGYQDFQFDFDGSEADRRQARQRAVAIWRDRLEEGESNLGLILEPEVENLKASRDDRPITVLE